MSIQDGKRLTPYGTVSPGFEAIYTGEKESGGPSETKQGPITRIVDDDGNGWPRASDGR